jgi:hypothetical protein
MKESWNDVSTNTSFYFFLLKPQSIVATNQAEFAKTNKIYSCSQSDINSNQQD